jgi:hypothetical protein
VDWADDNDLYGMSDGYMEQTLRYETLVEPGTCSLVFFNKGGQQGCDESTSITLVNLC